jgi:hypothetical protein
MVRQATTSSPSGSGQQHGPSGRQSWRLPPARSRVSVPWVLFGLLLVVGLGLAGVVVIDQVDERQAVLAVARPVEIGQPISELDLTTIQVAAEPGAALLPADAHPEVVGQPAAIRLTPGMLLAPAAVGAPAGLTAQEALVGVALEAGRYPPEVTAGASVTVVEVLGPDQAGGQGQGDPSGRVLTDQAVVLAVHAPPEQIGGASVVTLTVPLGAVGPVSAAAAAGRVALVQVAPEGST